MEELFLLVLFSPWSVSLVWALEISLLKQTNCKMYLHYTVHLYCTLYHNDQRSVSKKVACEEDLREKWNGDLWGHMEVARNIWLWFICRKPLGRIGHNMLKWLVIQLLNRFLIKVMIVLLLGRLKIGVTVVMPKYILWK